MMQIAEKKYYQNCLNELIHVALADGKINKLKIETIINKRSLIDNQPPVFFNCKGVKDLRHIIDFRITAAALNCGLYFRALRELAFVSGAGIAGLAASFVLRSRGFKVVIAEKRKVFSRSNVINFNVEIQPFLKEFDLLKEFEEFVAARIKSHRIVHVRKKGSQNLALSDVSQLQLGNVPFEPESFDKLFTEEGIYSVKIQDLQTFLTQKVLEAGVQIFGNVEVEVLAHTQARGISRIQITGKDGLCNSMILQPHLFFVAEGAHSTTAERLGLEKRVVKNECTDEHWIYGNVEYSGKETFVVSIIDTSEENLEIANVIFNAKIQKINIAVTSKKLLSPKLIQERLLRIVQLAFRLEGIEGMPQSLIAVVKHPVHVKNEERVTFSRDNIFIIGDAAGHSSPLAGLGGTIGLTLIPRTIKQLLNDREQQPLHMHNNFKRFSSASNLRWREKSLRVKQHCIGIFNEEQILNERSELLLKRRAKDEN
jgi:2-polyprenyl-6-methoxyphenol hydroxylase-like FAD-dependent oxidoreductase